MMLPLFSYSQNIPNRPTDTINVNEGKRTSNDIWLHPKTNEIVGLKMGPFINISDKKIMTVDTTNCYVSNNNGSTWKSFPIFKNPEKLSATLSLAV